MRLSFLAPKIQVAKDFTDTSKFRNTKFVAELFINFSLKTISEDMVKILKVIMPT